MIPSPRRVRRYLPGLIALVMVTAACASGGTGGTTSGPGPWPFTTSAAAVGGGQIDGGDYEGQDLVLWFWAPW